MLEHIEAVIFDLDGSLVDSMWIWEQIDIEYLGKFGIAVPQGLQEEIGGMSFSETADYFKARFSLPDPVDKIKQDWNRMAWEKYSHQVPLKKGIPDFLTYCRKHGIKLGIATSNSRELVDNIVKVHRLENVFSCVKTACDVGKGKPAPDIYLAVSAKLRVLPEKCLVFEDIVPGILAGKAAGMQVCAVEDDFSLPQTDEKKRLADYYIRDYTEIYGEQRKKVSCLAE